MMLNFSKLLAHRVLYTQKAAIVFWSRKSPLYKSIIIKRCTYHTSQEKKSFCCSEFVCKVREIAGLFSPWFILRKIGIPCNLIIKFRRGIRRFAFPWLLYSFPVAMAMGIGDILAQMHKNSHSDGCVDKKLTDIDKERTAKFMLIGFFIVGPILSRMNKIIMRRISFYPTQSFLIKRTAINVLVVSPILLLLAMSIYDYEQILDCQKYGKMHYLWNKRYKCPFKEIMAFNLMTRPLIDFLICLLPHCVRPFVRRPYEILFFAYVSSVVHKYKLGHVSNMCKPPPPQKPKRFCRLRRSCNR